MDAVTTYHASQNLDFLIDRVIANAEPTILCNNKGSRAVLMALDEFNSWQETLYIVKSCKCRTFKKIHQGGRGWQSHGKKTDRNMKLVFTETS